MPDFKTIIDDFFEGRIGFKDLRDGLDRAVAESPESTPAILSALEDHYRAGDLHMQLWLYLRARLAPKSPREGDGARVQQPAAYDAQAAQQAHEHMAVPPRSGTVARGVRDTIARRIEAARGKLPGREGISPRVGVGTILDHRFALDEVIARTAMGVIYKARDLHPEDGRQREPYLAIEVLDADSQECPDAFTALPRKKALSLAHLNIATVFDFERDGDTPYMTMELLEGETLEQFIERRWPRGLALQDALSIIEGMAHALAYAHRHGVLHSGLMPGNIFLTADRIPKVLNFGLARAPGRPGDSEHQKRASGMDLPEPSLLAYASCEMLQGLEPDPRDDVYGLACVAYELLAGRHPFNGMPAITAREEGMRPLPIKGLARRRFKALLRGLAFRREERLSSALDLLEELMGNPHSRSQSYEGRAWAPGIFAAALAGVAIYWLAPALGPRPSGTAALPDEQDISQPWLAATPPGLESLGQYAEGQMQGYGLTTLAGDNTAAIDWPVPELDTDRAGTPEPRARPKGDRDTARQETTKQIVQKNAEPNEKLSSLNEPPHAKQAAQRAKATLALPIESEEIEEMYRRALRGSSLAEFTLARKYMDGDGVPQDSAEAVRWLRRAAEHGSRGAQVNIGVMYAEGRGVRRDYSEAMKWFQRAAVRGNADASFNIGILYENGRGVPQDLDKAAKWYRRAADRGIVEAEDALRDIESR